MTSAFGNALPMAILEKNKLQMFNVLSSTLFGVQIVSSQLFLSIDQPSIVSGRI